MFIKIIFYSGYHCQGRNAFRLPVLATGL